MKADAHDYDMILAADWRRSARCYGWAFLVFGFAFLSMLMTGVGFRFDWMLGFTHIDSDLVKEFGTPFALSTACFLPLRGAYHCLLDWQACHNWADLTLAREASGMAAQAKAKARAEDTDHFKMSARLASTEVRGFFGRMFEKMKRVVKKAP